MMPIQAKIEQIHKVVSVLDAYLARIPRRVWLGDYLGPLHHLGQCYQCGRQFMSPNMYIVVQGATRYCERCGAELAKEPIQ